MLYARPPRPASSLATIKVRWVKSGAAPLAPDLARRFTQLTNIPVCQGYGMTEASPVTHVGFLEPELYRPDSIGHPLAATDCRVLSQSDIDPADTPDDLTEAPSGQPGELVMRGPQFMLGYWKEPQATAAVLRDGWFWSGDIVTRDREGFYRVVDRRKEMIKYKGFAVAPAEVEAVLLEHPAVKDCGVVGRSRRRSRRNSRRLCRPARRICRQLTSLEKNSAASSPTASPTTSSRARSTSSTPFPRRPPEKSCAANCEIHRLIGASNPKRGAGFRESPKAGAPFLARPVREKWGF